MRKLRKIFLKAALIAAAVITGGILLFLIGIILKRGLPQLSWSFLTTATSYLAGTTGILPNICNTLYLILIAMGAALPLGVGAAVYITEYAENPRVVRLISFAAETLTGIPSILFGLIGMLFFIKLGALRQGVLAGGLTLALMVLPTVMANTRESLLAVPRAYREGALALGSGKWHMVRTVVLPNATVKIFLTASAEARAQRRAKELAEKGQPADFATVLADIRQRDYQDSHRAVAPLKQADDAILVDTSSIGLQESFDLLKRTILAHI